MSLLPENPGKPPEPPELHLTERHQIPQAVVENHAENRQPPEGIHGLQALLYRRTHHRTPEIRRRRTFFLSSPQPGSPAPGPTGRNFPMAVQNSFFVMVSPSFLSGYFFHCTTARCKKTGRRSRISPSARIFTAPAGSHGSLPSPGFCRRRCRCRAPDPSRSQRPGPPDRAGWFPHRPPHSR